MTLTRQRVRGGVGESAARPDGVPKVRGAFLYASDLREEGMLSGHTLRSPHPHALIRSIDASAAREMPGVRAILTERDLPTRERFGLMKRDQPVLAEGRVRYEGEAVAIVAADDIDQARAAAKAIRVEYEVLASVSDPIAALRSDAPRLHDEGNVIDDALVVHGDPDATADVVVSGEYEVAMQDQAALGPEAGLAIPHEDGGVTLHIATQWLHEDLGQIAPALGLPKEKVRLVLAGVGGAFGAREDVTLQIHACLLALATKRPVRMSYGREESFYGHVHRHPARLFYEHGARRDGTLVYVRATIVLDGGAYASSSSAVVANAACFAAGPYRVPNARVRSVGAYTTNPPAGAMRGFGAVQTCFAYEAQMDKLAAALGMDPVELRARNALEDGDEIITSQPVEGSEPVANLIRRCAALPLPEDATPRDPLLLPGGAGNLTHGEGIRRGTGFAAGFKNVCYSHGFDDVSHARVRLERIEGRVRARVHTAAAEVGQGIVTVCQQIVRTELEVEEVIVETPDTTIGSAGSSSASRQTWMTGGAVLAACREVRAAIEERARALGRPAHDLAALLDEPLERSVAWRHKPTEERNAHTQNHGHVAFLFAAHRATVDVDLGTGLVKVVQVATSQDVGKAINPQAVVGQLEGGIAQGLGLAVMEEVLLRDGKVRNASFTDYLLPTILDMPPVVCDLVEHPHPDAPYGAKGVGEPPTISSTPAIVAAIRAATGRDLNRVPVRPDDIVFGTVARSGWTIVPGESPTSAVLEREEHFDNRERFWRGFVLERLPPGVEVHRTPESRVEPASPVRLRTRTGINESGADRIGPKRVILSRKGFDLSNGGYASPVLPGSRVLSLPIPSLPGPLYEDVRLPTDVRYGTSVSDLLRQLRTRQRRGLGAIDHLWSEKLRISLAEARAHPDPELDADGIDEERRREGWLPMLGQAGDAQGQLQRQGIAEGDLFLFFGRFCHTRETSAGELVYEGDDFHYLWGYLEVGRVIDVATATSFEPWMLDHVHVKYRGTTGWPTDRNTLYVAKAQSSFRAGPGGGVFKMYRPELRLTRRPDESLVTWELPFAFHPTQTSKPLTYHGDAKRWSSAGKRTILRSVSRGQEFVVEVNEGIDDWLRRVVFT